ncbi:MAG: 2-oxoacid:acceptor oxidoreductase family protein [Christensenellaceae bacterium]|jgi:2-oxoglutarate ferredoxin oxidoreductase subunit gamma|nr:2-oxoacid:acceptor oxidoreductase family protein [Christensenellaceae bacterium]
MEETLIIAGFGGQGVQLIGQLLAKSGMMEGKHVSFLPSYGPEMRGGNSNCNVIIADEPICSPIVGQASCVMALNRPSLDKFEPSVQEGQTLLVNSSLVDKKAARGDIEALYIPANDIAQELGNARVANMVMLGAYLGVSGSVQVDTVMENLREMFGERRANLLPVNREAIERGVACVKGQRG